MDNYINGTLKEIGGVLKSLREEKGFTNGRTFAVRFGLDPTQYWRMESGSYNYTLESLMKVLDIHHLSLKEFAGIFPQK